MNKKLYDIIEINSRLFPLIRTNVYFTDCGYSPSEIYENEMDELERAGQGEVVSKFWDYIQEHEENYINTVIIPSIQDTISFIFKELDYLNLGIKEFKYTGFEATNDPYGDWINYQLIVDDNFTSELIKQLGLLDQGKLKKELKERYQSRDGFISFTACELEEFKEEISNGNTREISAGLLFLLENSNESIYNDVTEEFQECICNYNDPIQVVDDGKLADQLSISLNLLN